ncbi:hypothetical protein ACP70R_004370 [Stipagrostis hirtigluma subsp. patula]
MTMNKVLLLVLVGVVVSMCLFMPPALAARLLSSDEQASSSSKLNYVVSGDAMVGSHFFAGFIDVGMRGTTSRSTQSILHIGDHTNPSVVGNTLHGVSGVIKSALPAARDIIKVTKTIVNTVDHVIHATNQEVDAIVNDILNVYGDGQPTDRGTVSVKNAFSANTALTGGPSHNTGGSSGIFNRGSSMGDTAF